MIGPYEILEELAPAAHGARRLEAQDTRSGHPVLLSLAPAQALEQERFQRRARALARLENESILQVYEVGEDYLALELVEGQPLSQAFPEFTQGQRLELFTQLLKALGAAHSVGVAHTELRPECVLVTQEGLVKLDFSPTLQAGASDLLETLPYLAPEQAQAGSCDDPRVDIYALGAVLYELLCDRPPFVGGTALELIDQVLHHPPAPTGAPLALERVALRALSKDPEARYQTVSELAEELGHWSGPVEWDDPADNSTPIRVRQEARPFQPFFQSLGVPRITSSDWLDG